MLRATKSELIRLMRPSFLLTGIGLMALFGALGTFISFSAAGSFSEAESAAGPAAFFPPVEALAQSDGFVVGLTLGAQLLGIVALSLWAIAVASDYSTGLIRLLAQAQPSRLTLLFGKLTALVLFTLVGTLVATAAAAGTAYLIAPAFDVSTSAWGTDTLSTLLEAYRNLSLSTLVWGVIGFTIATITRSSGVAIGAGIGWIVVFETMLVGTAPDIADWMPGTVLTALAAGGLPNVDFDTAIILAASYFAVGIIVSAVIMQRREITY